MLSAWWVWVVAGLALGVLEMLAPGYVFLGFAAGAVVTGGLIRAGVLGASVPVVLVVFGVVSLLAWVGLRQGLGVRRGQVKRIDRDINDG